MMPKIDPVRTPAWKKLEDHFRTVEPLSMRDLFQNDPDRFSRFSLRFEDIHFDFSKNRIVPQTMGLFRDLLKEIGLPSAVEAMFKGEAINETENRPVLHAALRNRSGHSFPSAEADVMPDVRKVLERMKAFSDCIGSGLWTGHTGKPIAHVVNIGIGGSDLGPSMVCEALAPYRNPKLSVSFVSNIDGAALAEVLRTSDPAATLFVVSSKTFTTLETMTNARSAREWVLGSLEDPQAVRKHFVAVSTNQKAVTEFGIDPENMFEFWDWVGGRFSLWSAIGLSIACGVGFTRFVELLEGAFAMDEHFRTMPMEKNIPMVMACLGMWYVNFFGVRTHAVVPYDQGLRHFPAYLQQLDMESNGKSSDRNGKPVSCRTGPVVWGDAGTNGQHAFFQLLHQGTEMVPVDFLAPAQSHHPIGDHHVLLLSNMLAQSEALMKGKTAAEAEAELVRAGKSGDSIAKLLPFKVFEGNRPSNIFLFRKLTPRTLGSLLAMYEHKIFVQGVIWNVFSFDQWGVELGKELAMRIVPELKERGHGDHDSSTCGLIKAVNQMKGLGTGD